MNDFRIDEFEIVPVRKCDSEMAIDVNNLQRQILKLQARIDQLEIRAMLGGIS